MKQFLLALMMFQFSLFSAQFPMQEKLLLPEQIYAVPGMECSVYFENVFLTVNPSNYVFTVSCKKGRCDEKRWRMIPKGTDTGTYDWTLTVENEREVVARRTVSLVVVPADAGKGRTVSLLMVGSSHIEMGHHYPTELHRLMTKPDNPVLRMIGENGPGWPAVTGPVRHEGYGGWTWYGFLSRGRNGKTFNHQYGPPGKYVFHTKGRNEKILKYARDRMNPFWNPNTEKLDFKGYLQRNNQGQAPDFLMISLGGNDVFLADDSTIQKRCTVLEKQISTFLKEFRSCAPRTVIGIAVMTCCARSQDAFGNNYGCLQTRWQTRKNNFHYNRMLVNLIRSLNDPRVTVLPLIHALDNDLNARVQQEPVNQGNRRTIPRQCNGLHPKAEGYAQHAAAACAWLKYQCTRNFPD